MVCGSLVGCRRLVRDVEFLGESGKSRIRGPEAVSTDDSRGQHVDINPSDPLAMQTALTYEGDDISMRNRSCLMHLLRRIEQLSTAAAVTDKWFAKNEFVASYFVPLQQRIEFGGVGLATREEANPHRRVDKHHQAARRLRAAGSRRLGMSFAFGSEPLSARRRSYAA